MNKRILIIGGNAAGPAAAAKAKRSAPDAEVTIIEREPYISTGTCELAYVISGEVDSPEKIVYFDADSFREKKGVNVHINMQATGINRKEKTVSLEHIETGASTNLAYDKLILCTGSKPVVIPPYQPDLNNVFYLKNVAGLERILDFKKDNTIKTAAVIGAGYIGIEAAESFAKLGINTFLLDIADHPLPQTEVEIQHLVEKLINKNGITFIAGANKPDISIEQNSIRHIKVKGNSFEPDIVVAALGFIPDTGLAASAGLETADNGAIKINNKMQTSDTNIYAAGDNVMITNAVTLKQDYLPIATYAYKGGHIAGANAAGENEHFQPIVPNVAVRVFDHFVTNVGLSTAQADSLGIAYQSVYATANSKVPVMPNNSKVFGKILFEKESKRLIGAAFFGTNEVGGYADILSTAIRFKVKATELVSIDYNYTPPLSPFVHLLSILGKKADSA